jgi:hypothetical protein
MPLPSGVGWAVACLRMSVTGHFKVHRLRSLQSAPLQRWCFPLIRVLRGKRGSRFSVRFQGGSCFPLRQDTTSGQTFCLPRGVRKDRPFVYSRSSGLRLPGPCARRSVCQKTQLADRPSVCPVACGRTDRLCIHVPEGLGICLLPFSALASTIGQTSQHAARGNNRGRNQLPAPSGPGNECP